MSAVGSIKGLRCEQERDAEDNRIIRTLAELLSIDFMCVGL